MDRDVIEEKIEALRRCVHRVEEKRVSTIEELEQDWDTQDIISVNLTRAVQLCVDIAAHLISEQEAPPPDTMAQGFDQLQERGILSEELARHLKGAVGFRNIAIHAYRSIDWQIVHSLTHERLDDFRHFAQAILEHLDR